MYFCAFETITQHHNKSTHATNSFLNLRRLIRQLELCWGSISCCMLYCDVRPPMSNIQDRRKWLPCPSPGIEIWISGSRSLMNWIQHECLVLRVLNSPEHIQWDDSQDDSVQSGRLERISQDGCNHSISGHIGGRVYLLESTGNCPTLLTYQAIYHNDRIVLSAGQACISTIIWRNLNKNEITEITCSLVAHFAHSSQWCSIGYYYLE